MNHDNWFKDILPSSVRNNMFAVIYRFKVKPEREKEFEKHWSDMTHEFRNLHGGLGSCLHRADDGLLYAYARWPDRASWEKEKIIVNQLAMNHMRDCMEGSLPAIPLEVINDLLT